LLGGDAVGRPLSVIRMICHARSIVRTVSFGNKAPLWLVPTLR
jgi:hypothetical protein